MDEIIMELRVNSGRARSKAMESIMEIKQGHSEVAKKNIEKADEFLVKANNFQKKLIEDKENGNRTELNLLIVHAQDHLMDAITITDLAKEIIEMYEEFS